MKTLAIIAIGYAVIAIGTLLVLRSCNNRRLARMRAEADRKRNKHLAGFRP